MLILWIARVLFVVMLVWSFRVMIEGKNKTVPKTDVVTLLALAGSFQLVSILVHPLVGIAGTIGLIGAMVIGFGIKDNGDRYAPFPQTIAVYSFMLLFSVAGLLEIAEAVVGRLF